MVSPARPASSALVALAETFAVSVMPRPARGQWLHSLRAGGVN